MKSIGAGVIALIAGLVLAAQPTGRVVRITDGDTIEVLFEGRTEPVRLIGIDAPERGQAFGQRAQQHVASLCFGKVVTLSDTSRDAYGRLLAIVVTDSVNVNHAMVRDGFAWHFVRYSSDTTLGSLEREARAAHRGLWSDAHPIAPWNFGKGEYETRQAEPETATTTVYVTRTGRQYHTAGCSYLRSSSIPMALREAVAAGYAPCSRCNPPRLETQQPPARPSPDAGAVIVYVTRTGAKYHSAGCSYLRGSSRAMSLKDAKAAGYTPCSRCNPPR